MNKTNQKLWAEALAFATAAHGRQMRKGSQLPYITHPVAVAEILGRHYPDKPELAIAGLLHDVVEDTPVGLEEIRTRFGERIATLVDGVTARQGADWRATRQAQIDHISDCELDVLRLKLADISHNAASILADLEISGSDVWKRFRGSPDDVLWYYRGVLSVASARLRGEPLLSLYERTVMAMGRLR